MKLLGKQKIFSNLFESIDTQEKAYILGLISADGYINIKRNNIELSLKQSDISILEKIKTSIGLNVSIKIKNDKRVNREGQARIVIYSKKLVQDLINKGYDNNKTFSLKFPNFIPDNLIPHYLRGYFDGDGHINYTPVKNSVMVFSQLIGPLNFVEGCKIYFQNNGIKSNYYKENSIYRLKIYGVVKNKLLYNLLYNKPSFYLERKYKTWQKVVNYKLKV